MAGSNFYRQIGRHARVKEGTLVRIPFPGNAGLGSYGVPSRRNPALFGSGGTKASLIRVLGKIRPARLGKNP